MGKLQDAHRAAGPSSVGVFLVTLSDTRDAKTDETGALLRTALVKAGHVVVDTRIVREDEESMRREIESILDRPGYDVLIVTGGTGISPRDRAYDLLHPMYERHLPGFGELFRALSYAEIGSAALLSRASAGVTRGKIVLSIPGSPGAVRLALDKLILPELGHLVGQLRRPARPGTPS